MKNQKLLSDISVALPKTAAILNFLLDELSVLKINGAFAEPGMVEIEIPPNLIGGELVFARVQIWGDIMAFSFHFYPDDVVAEVKSADPIPTDLLPAPLFWSLITLLVLVSIICFMS